MKYMEIMKPIYLDYQATTPVASEVLVKMLPYFTNNFGNPHSSDHFYGWKSAEAVDTAASQIAKMIGAESDEIIFTSGASESNNMALLGLAKFELKKGGKKKRVLISAIEHKCVIEVARKLKEYGFQIDIIGVDQDGLISISELQSKLDHDVLVVSIMAVNNEIGTIQNITEIGKLLRASNTLFHCDGAQAPLAMDMTDLANQVDLLSLSAHKIYGPKGIGALYIRRELKANLEPLIYGGGQQYGLRSGTVPTPLCVGMGYACELIKGNEYQHKIGKLQEKRDYFVQSLINLSSVKVSLNGPEGFQRHPGNVNVCFHERNAYDILNILHAKLAASTGSACSSGIQEPSYVLKAIGLSSEAAESSIRFSLGIDTTLEELDIAINSLRDVLNNFDLS